MRLLKMRVTDFKRFVGTHALEVDEQLVALVGPNEAGKSSLLTALDRIGSRERPRDEDRTRNSDKPCTIEAHYSLDEDDAEAIAHIHDSGKVKTVTITRHSNNEAIEWDLHAKVIRDLGPRERCHAALTSIGSDPALDARYSTDPEWTWSPEQFTQAVETLTSTEDTLTDEQLGVLDHVVNRLRALKFEWPDEDENPYPHLTDETLADNAKARTDTANTLAAQTVVEREPNSWRKIVDVLESRLPATALFTREERVLEGHYDLAAVADNPPPALKNLAKVAGLNLPELRDLQGAGRPRIETLLDAGNERLKERFLTSWRQARIFPHFTLDGTLQIYVSTESEDFSYPAERSDGLRWFLALFAFLLSRQADDLILLVDEAETHLHYDAQADLIDALMSQEIASKVIYTTHSIGCLPPDLGRGIRAVVPLGDAEESTIKNTYWWLSPGEDEKVGHIPLLFGMGASLLALTVPRFAVIAEGPSDAILLPSILRLVSGGAPLPYRVVPGLSEIKNEHMPRLQSHAGSIVCLVDGDGGGRRTERNLTKNKIPRDRVLSLGKIGKDAALEDLVLAKVFTDAVNAEVTNWGGSGPLDPDTIDDFGRWVWLKKHHAQVEDSLNKNRVAGRMADAVNKAKAPEDVLPKALIKAITQLDTDIRSALGCVAPEPEPETTEDEEPAAP